MRQAINSLFMISLALAGTAWGTGPGPTLGHPAKLSLVLEQFPLGVESTDFPIVSLPTEAEGRLRDSGIPVVPRGLKSEAPSLHLSVAVIRQASGFVLLVQADLRENIPSACTDGTVLEVSTWQHRQWSTVRGDSVATIEIRKATDAALREFIRTYLAKK